MSFVFIIANVQAVMAYKTRGASSARSSPLDICPVSVLRKAGDSHGHKDLPWPTGTSRRLIKPTMHAAGFVHQAGHQRALLAAKEAATEPPSDTIALPPVASPTVTSPPSEASSADPPCPVDSTMVTSLPSEASSADPLHPVASPKVASLPSEVSSANPLHPVTSPTAASLPSEAPLADPSCPVASPKVTSLPFEASSADQPTAGPSCIAEVQIDPILLALSTALMLDFESSVNLEVNNEDTPPPSQLLDDPIAGIPTAHSPTGDNPDAN